MVGLCCAVLCGRHGGEEARRQQGRKARLSEWELAGGALDGEGVAGAVCGWCCDSGWCCGSGGGDGGGWTLNDVVVLGVSAIHVLCKFLCKDRHT